MTLHPATVNALLVDESGNYVAAGGGGGGGAATIADGADVAQGTTTDTAAALTVIGLLKNLKAALAGSIAVTGTFFQATQPVSGTVTTSRATTGAAPTAFTSTASAVIFASNASRKLLTIYNGTDKDLYVMLAAAAATTSSYHVIVKANGGYYETATYSGEVRGIMSAAIVSGVCMPGEFT